MSKFLTLALIFATVGTAQSTFAADAKNASSIFQGYERQAKSFDNQTLVESLNHPRLSWLYFTPKHIINEVVERANNKLQSKEILIRLSKEIEANGIRADYIAETLTLSIEKSALSIDDLDEDLLVALERINSALDNNVGYFGFHQRALPATRKLLSHLYSEKNDYSKEFLFTMKNSSYQKWFGSYNTSFSLEYLFEESIRENIVDKLFESSSDLSVGQLFHLANSLQSEFSHDRFDSVLTLLFSRDRAAAILRCTEETLSHLSVNTVSEQKRLVDVTTKWQRVCARFTNDEEFNNLLNTVRAESKNYDYSDYPYARNNGRSVVEYLESMRFHNTPR